MKWGEALRIRRDTKLREMIEMEDVTYGCTCEKGNDASHVTSSVEDCAVHGTCFGGPVK